MNTSSLAEPVVEVDAPPMPEASANSTAAACATAESPATAAPPATAASPATESIRAKKRKRDVAKIFEEQLKALNEEKPADEWTLFGEEIAIEMRKFKDPYKQALTKRAIRDCIFFNLYPAATPHTSTANPDPDYSLTLL